MKSALITGTLGQDGSFLAEHLLNQGYKVFGLVRRAAYSCPWVASYAQKIFFIYGDIRDELSLRVAIKKSWPDEVYNLAGQVFVPVSWENPSETFDVNVGGLARILWILEQVKRDTRVYQASSSEMIGNFEGSFNESTPMNPTSPYGVSKLAAHKLAGLYRDRGLYVCAGILSNHESERRGSEFVTKKIASAVAAWNLGDETPLSLGRLDSRRDWGYAGEYVQAMNLILQQPEPSDYVVGTGVSHSVREFLDECCLAAGIDARFCEAHVKIDERFIRQQEIYDMYANTEKIEKQTGWKPKVKFKELVRTMVRAEILALKTVREEEVA